MSLLLDTHALIWWLNDDKALSPSAAEGISDQHRQVFVSAASAMEVATKYRLGKLSEAEFLASRFVEVCEGQRFDFLPVTIEHAALAGALPIPHKDPFDRLLIAQAQIEQLRLVSNQERFDNFGVRRLW